MLNVIPLNDLEGHIEETTCNCFPELEIIDGGMLIIHNSFDNREETEIKTGKGIKGKEWQIIKP